VRNLITHLLVALALATSASAGSFTRTLNLYVPDVGEIGYGAFVSQGFVDTDETCGCIRLTGPSGSVVGDAIYIDGSGDAQLSQANSIATARVDGFVYDKVASTDIRVILSGRVAVPGLVAGTTYYLDTATAGKLTSSAPVAPDFAVPVGVAYNDNGTAVLAVRSGIDDPSNNAGSLQDAYDNGPSTADVVLDINGGLSFDFSSGDEAIDIDDPTGDVIISADTGVGNLVRIQGFPGTNNLIVGDDGDGTDVKVIGEFTVNSGGGNTNIFINESTGQSVFTPNAGSTLAFQDGTNTLRMRIGESDPHIEMFGNLDMGGFTITNTPSIPSSFQALYDLDAAAAAFDLDAGGSFTVNFNGTIPAITVDGSAGDVTVQPDVGGLANLAFSSGADGFRVNDAGGSAAVAAAPGGSIFLIDGADQSRLNIFSLNTSLLYDSGAQGMVINGTNGTATLHAESGGGGSAALVSDTGVFGVLVAGTGNTIVQPAHNTLSTNNVQIRDHTGTTIFAVEDGFALAQTKLQLEDGNELVTGFRGDSDGQDITLVGPVTTFTPDQTRVNLTADAGGNTIGTITTTNLVEGDRILINAVDIGGGLTFTDTASPGAGQMALEGDWVPAVDDTLLLEYTGTYFQEISRSNLISSIENFMNITEITATADFIAAPGAYATISGMTDTPAAGTYMVTFSTSGATSNNGSSIDVAIHVAGVIVQHSERTSDSNQNKVIHTQALVTVNGAEVVDVQWVLAGAGTATVHERVMLLTRVAD
jgi:hypothetical protein